MTGVDGNNKAAVGNECELLKLPMSTCKITVWVLEETLTTYLAVKATEYLGYGLPITLSIHYQDLTLVKNDHFKKCEHTA